MQPLDFALRYAQRGIPVLPLHTIKNGSCTCHKADCNRAGKHPYGHLVPRGLQDASTNPVILRDWWGPVPSLNVGMRTGMPAGLLVIDVDNGKPGANASEALLIQEYPVLERTLTQTTGSGGRHYLLRYSGAEDLRPGQNVFGVGIDIRANDSYIVAPPSLHLSGGVYRWDNANQILPAPPELIARLQEKREAMARVLAENKGQRIPKGIQHFTLLSFGGMMNRYGATEDEIFAALWEMGSRCEEPPTEAAVRRIARDAAKYASKKPIVQIVANVVKATGVKSDIYKQPAVDNDMSKVNLKATPEVQFLPLRDSIFGHIPLHLQKVTQNLEEKHERDLFITGCLPVLAGCMPNVLLRYGSQWQCLNLYACVVGPASAGKGKLRLAYKLAEPLNERLYYDSKKAAQDYVKNIAQAEDAEEKASVEAEKPPFRRFFIAGDTSAAKIKESMADTPHGVIFETEAKSLSSALNNEWGQFRDVLLKGFHNEPISVDRKFQLPLIIPRPALSLCLSGTPGSFEGILTDTEDGLFSRILFYYFETAPEFSNQFESAKDYHVANDINELAERLTALYKILVDRVEPLYINIDAAEQDYIVAAGKQAMEVVKAGGDLNLQANVRRAALVAFRIGAIFTVLDHFLNGNELSEVKALTIRPEFNKAAVGLAYSYVEHAFRLSQAMREGHSLISTTKMRVFNALPIGEFTLEQAYEELDRAGLMGKRKEAVSDRTVRRYLAEYCEKGQLEDRGYGKYFRNAQDNAYVSMRSLLDNL